MSTQTIEAVPMGNYPANSYALNSTPIPDNVTNIGIGVARCTSADPTVWPLASVSINASLEFSPNNGATWFPWGKYTAVGGIQLGRGGVEVAEGSISQSVPAGTNRRLRGTVLVAGGTIRTRVTVTLTSP